MVSNSYNSNAYGAMPVSTVGTADTNPNFTGIPPSADTFTGASPKKEEKKEGKNWVPHWLATGLSFFGGIAASMGIDAIIAKKTKLTGRSQLIASCIGGAATAFGFEWFRQENNDGKISTGSLAMNTIFSGLPIGHYLNKMLAGKAGAAAVGAAADTTTKKTGK